MYILRKKIKECDVKMINDYFIIPIQKERPLQNTKNYIIYKRQKRYRFIGFVIEDGQPLRMRWYRWYRYRDERIYLLHIDYFTFVFAFLPNLLADDYDRLQYFPHTDPYPSRSLNNSIVA